MIQIFGRPELLQAGRLRTRRHKTHAWQSSITHVFRRHESTRGRLTLNGITPCVAVTHDTGFETAKLLDAGFTHTLDGATLLPCLAAILHTRSRTTQVLLWQLYHPLPPSTSRLDSLETTGPQLAAKSITDFPPCSNLYEIYSTLAKSQ